MAPHTHLKTSAAVAVAATVYTTMVSIATIVADSTNAATLSACHNPVILRKADMKALTGLSTMVLIRA